MQETTNASKCADCSLYDIGLLQYY